MLTQTKEVRDAWRASQRTLDIKVAVNGKTYTATDINSLKYDSGAYTGDTFSIGSTYSNNVQIEFSHLVEGLKLGMEVHPSIGIKTSKGYIYEPLGVFIISSEIKMDRNNNLTSISASDRFCGLEGTYKSKLVYPAKVLDIVAEICAQSGVKANADDLARLPHQADLPIPISGQSYRKALGWIAQLYAGYATFDRQGLFTIRTIAEPNYELDPSQYEQAGLTKNEAPYKIGGIQCQTVITTKTRDGENTEETKTYQVGDTSGSQIKLENNIMTPDRLNNIWEQIKDISFYPFNLNWFGNPAIEAGDWLRLEDKQGNKFIVPNNSYTLDFNGGLSATSKADQTSSTDSAISWRGTYAQIIEELQARKAPDGTVIFPPSVAEPPKNAKPNDVWFKQNGNSTELWVFTAQEDGSGKSIRRDITPDEIKKQVQEAQSGLNDAKKQIADNLAKADKDIAELNESINNQKGSLDGLSTTVNTVVIPKVTDVTNQVSDTITKVNEQKNIVTELQNQAIQQGKDISKITTDIHGVTVDLANINGDVNQTKATVQGLQSTLGNAQGDIVQIKADAKKLETSLSGKVDNSTYANFVSATNNALNAKLVASDLNGYAKTTDLQATANGLQLNINSVTDKLNNLRIGTDNLLNGTGNFKDYLTKVGGQIDEFSKVDFIPPIQNHPEITAYMHSWGDWQSAYSNQRILLEKGKTYWFGFYYCTDSSGSPCKAFNIYSNKNNETSNAKLWGYFDTSDYSFFGNSSRKWLWCTLKIIGDGAVYQNFRVEPSGIVANSAYFAGYTLVQSDVAPTGHVDSFEDTKHELSQLSAQITANNQKFSSYYTKIETDNRANSAKNDAVNAIKNDNNWHGLSNILTNSGFLQNADGFIQKVQQATIPMFSGSGINLVSGTSNAWGDSGWNDFNGTSNQTKVIGKFSLDSLTAGDWVTLYLEYQYQNLSGSNLSIIVQGTGDKTGWSYEPFNLPWQSLQASSNLNWVSFNKTFQITNEALKNNYFTVQIRIDNAKGGWLQWRNFKIEKGKVATPWSASPNDYTNLKSQISQTAGTIRSEITDKTTNLQSQITQNANSFNIRLQNATSGGGINLARNTSDIWNDSGWNDFNGASNQTKIITQVYFEGLHVGDWVTGYIEYQYQNLSGNDMHIYIQGFGNKTVWNGSQFGPSAQQLFASSDVKHGEFKFSFQLTEDMVYTWRNNYYNVQLRVDNAKGGWLQWNRIKFEKGTAATTWSPSPNDKVSKNKILAQINVASGTTLIQNEKIYMDASSTVFSGKAFIPDAAITNISADKINAGTLDAGRINVINLNANNITTGTINGANLKINLNSGEILFQKGRIASTNGLLNIDLNFGTMSVTGWGGAGVYFQNGKMILDDGTTPNLDLDLSPKYGMISRSGDPLNNGLFGMQLESPNGVIMKTKNYNGNLFRGWVDKEFNGAFLGVSAKGDTDIISGRHTNISGGLPYGDSYPQQPTIVIGTDDGRDTNGSGKKGSRIVLAASYVHFPDAYKTTTGSAPNMFIAWDGAIVRSTSASKYKTDIKRSHSTDYGEKLLNLPIATWTDKGQKERYETGKRHIKPEKYFGMIAEDLADAGLDLLVSRNPQTHEIEGIQYERIGPALLPVIKELKDKVNRLEKKVNE